MSQSLWAWHGVSTARPDEAVQRTAAAAITEYAITFMVLECFERNSYNYPKQMVTMVVRSYFVSRVLLTNWVT